MADLMLSHRAQLLLLSAAAPICESNMRVGRVEGTFRCGVRAYDCRHKLLTGAPPGVSCRHALLRLLPGCNQVRLDVHRHSPALPQLYIRQPERQPPAVVSEAMCPAGAACCADPINGHDRISWISTASHRLQRSAWQPTSSLAHLLLIST